MWLGTLFAYLVCAAAWALVVVGSRHETMKTRLTYGAIISAVVLFMLVFGGKRGSFGFYGLVDLIDWYRARQARLQGRPPPDPIIGYRSSCVLLAIPWLLVGVVSARSVINDRTAGVGKLLLSLSCSLSLVALGAMFIVMAIRGRRKPPVP